MVYVSRCTPDQMVRASQAIPAKVWKENPIFSTPDMPGTVVHIITLCDHIEFYPQ